MATEILKVCNPAERDLLDPHLENYRKAQRVYAAMVAALAPDLTGPDVRFVGEQYAWVRDVPDPVKESDNG